MTGEPKSTRLIQFAKAPQPGTVKTRMMPHLSAQQACDLHLELLQWTLETLLDCRLGPVELAIAGDHQHPQLRVFNGIAGLTLSNQTGRDLGQRMYSALSDALQHSSRVLLVGSDCPALDASYLRAAEAALASTPVVLGPALDGGYVLIGATRIAMGVFEDVQWGSAKVLEQSRANLRNAGLVWTELPALPDVDRPEDLPAWYRLRDAGR